MFWYGDGYPAVHRTERALPNGRFQLIIDLSDGYEREGAPEAERGQRALPPLVVGMRSQYTVLETAALQHMLGVVFWPGGTRELFDVPADAFYNDVIPLEQVWGCDATRLRNQFREARTPAGKFRALEAALRRHRAERLELHAAVRYALGTFAPSRTSAACSAWPGKPASAGAASLSCSASRSASHSYKTRPAKV
jgi:hypothetical protein